MSMRAFFVATLILLGCGGETRHPSPSGDSDRPAPCPDAGDGDLGLAEMGEACLEDEACNTGHCVDGVCCEAACDGACQACDDSGSCVPVPSGIDDACTTTCSQGICLLPNGAACDSADDCQSNACADGVCCDVACDGVCRSCAVAGEVGTCAPLRGVEEGSCSFSLEGARMCDRFGECREPHMLADIDTSDGPTQLTVLPGGKLVFEANSPGLGRELWSAAGGEARVLADIHEGAGSSSIRWMKRLGTVAVFLADDGIHGVEPWGTDGSTAWLIADISPGPTSSMEALYASPFTAFDGALYFIADDDAASSDLELWRTDGLAAEKLSINASGPAFDSERERPQVMEGALWVVAYAGASPNVRVFRIASNTASPVQIGGARQVEPINTFFTGPRAEMGGYLYLTANQGSTIGNEPVRVNTSGVVDVGDLRASGATYADQFVAHRGWVYFTAYGSATYPHDGELWRTNGTQTVQFTDINPGVESSNPLSATSVGEYLFFAAAEEGSNHSLWATDGTPGSVEQLAEASDVYGGIEVLAAVESPTGPALFFRRADLAEGGELWRSNGTRETTAQLTSFPGEKSAAPKLLAAGDWIYFAVDTESNGRELAYWHPTSDAHGVLDLAPGLLSSFPSDGVIDEATGDIYFTANDGHAFSLLKIPVSAQPEGIETVAVIAYGAKGSEPVAFTQGARGRVYFGADDSVHGSELWATDGVDEDVVLVDDLTTVSSPFGASLSSNIRSVGALGEQLFMSVAYEDSDGDIWELWATDTSGQNARRWFDEEPLNVGEGARFLALGGRMYFSARDRLFVSDGTEIGTTDIGSYWLDLASPPPTLGVVFDGWLYYYGGNSETDAQIWRVQTDTPEPFFDTSPGGPDAFRDGVVRGDGFYFLATDDAGADRVWLSDGTSGNTTPIFGNVTLSLSDLTVFEGRLWLVTRDATGTQRLGFIEEPGFTFAAVTVLGTDIPGRFTPVALGEHLFFSGPAESGDAWRELFFTDGTMANTLPACRNDYGCRDPQHMTVFDGRLYMQADVGSGAEVVVFP